MAVPEVPALSCTPSVVMQNASRRPKPTENADKPDGTEIVQLRYLLIFVIGMRKMERDMAERGGFEPPIEV